MSVTVVGSVALDTVETPMGKSVDGLGGAAVYFSLAASVFGPVHLVGVVGEDFPEEHVRLLEEKGIDIEGLEYAAGKTFRWSGRYHGDVNERDTLDTQLNVFEEFHPKLPAAAAGAPFLFLGNIHPALQMEVLSQARHRFAGLDTMNLWIDITLDELLGVLKRVDLLAINDAEAKQLTGQLNLRDAAARIQALGPRIVVIKKGEHGCMLFGEEPGQIFALPAFPLKNVVDPTGAGDSFAGGFMGYLASQQKTDFETLRQAAVFGTVMASFTCEAFGPDWLAEVDTGLRDARYSEFRRFASF